jgi:hypothetical protein
MQNRGPPLGRPDFIPTCALAVAVDSARNAAVKNHLRKSVITFFRNLIHDNKMVLYHYSALDFRPRRGKSIGST